MVAIGKMAIKELTAEEILKLLEEREVLDTYDLSQEFNKEHQQVVGTIKSLSSLGDVSKSTNYNFKFTKAV